MTGDEASSCGGRGGTVEIRVDVAADDVDDVADNCGVGLQDVEGLGGGAWAVVACVGELSLAAGDEAGEFAAGAVVIEDSLVTDDDELDQGPFTPGKDGRNVGGGHASEPGLVDEDTDDHLQAVGLAGSANVLESRAGRTVETDGGVSGVGNLLDIAHD